MIQICTKCNSLFNNESNEDRSECYRCSPPSKFKIKFDSHPFMKKAIDSLKGGEQESDIQKLEKCINAKKDFVRTAKRLADEIADECLKEAPNTGTLPDRFSETVRCYMKENRDLRRQNRLLQHELIQKENKIREVHKNNDELRTQIMKHISTINELEKSTPRRGLNYRRDLMKMTRLPEC